jgi:hypothetical protein
MIMMVMPGARAVQAHGGEEEFVTRVSSCNDNFQQLID